MCLSKEPVPADDASLTQVSIEVRYLSISPKLLAEVGLKPGLIVPATSEKPRTPKFSESVEADGDSPIQLISATTVVETKISVATQSLNDAQPKRPLETVQGNRRTSVLSVPKVTLFDGQSGEIRDDSKRPFVVEIDRNRQTDIQTIAEGAQLTVRPRLKNQGIALGLQIQFSNIVDVQEVAKNSNQRIQVATVKFTRIELSEMVGDGESLVIWFDPLPAEREASVEKLLSGQLRKKIPETESMNLFLLVTPRQVVGETKWMSGFSSVEAIARADPA